MLPNDIVRKMERFGQYEFNSQTSGVDPAEMGQLLGDLYPVASADPDGFMVALAEAVLPVGGWAVYGASRTIWELLSPSASPSIRQHPSYNAIMNDALEFLRTKGRSFMMLRPYEQDHWVASGGTRDTWMPRPPTSSQVATNPANIPDSPEMWVKAGIAHMQNGYYTEALAAYDHALALDPNHTLGWINKGNMLYALEQREEALVAYERALALDPNNAGVWYVKGLVLADLGYYEETLAAYDRTLALDANHALAWFNKGNALYKLGRNKESLVAYDHVLELDPNGLGGPGALGMKGVVLTLLGRYEEALATYDRVLVLDSNNVAAWSGKEVTLRALGRVAEAVAAERRARELGR
jgi:tetratricopeptide (TPR) repeat protein